MNRVALQLAHIQQMFDFSDRDSCRARHHGIEISRRLAVNQISRAIALPGLYESEIGGQSALHQVWTAIKFARLLAFGHHRAYAGGRVERRNTRAPSSNSLRKCSLRNQFELDLPGENQFFQ